MAQLPEVQIQPQSFSFPMGHVPSSEPLQQSIAGLSQEVNKQTTEVANVIMKQRQLINDRQSMNYFYDEYAKLKTRISDIKDASEQEEEYKKGMQDILSGVREKYPEMSPLIQAKILRIADAKESSFHLASQRKQIQQHKADVHAMVEDTVRQALSADNEGDRQYIMGSFINYLDQTVSAGIISDIQAKNLKDKVTMAFREGQFNQILATDPHAAVGLHHAETGVSWKKYMSGIAGANALIEKQERENDKRHQEEKKRIANDVMDGKYADNPGFLEGLHAAGWIDEKTVRIGRAYEPPNERSKAILMSIIEDTNWGGPAVLEEFSNNWIKHNDTMGQEDRGELLGAIANKKAELSNSHSLKALELWENLKDYGSSMSPPTSYIKLMPKGRQYLGYLNFTKARLIHAKDFNEQAKIFNEAQNYIEETWQNEQSTLPISPGQGISQNVYDNFEKSLGDPDLLSVPGFGGKP